MTQDQGRFWRYWFPKPGTSSTICNSNCFTEIPLTCSNRIVENLIQGYLDVHITDRFVSKIFHPCHSLSYCGKTRKNKERNGRTKMGRGKLKNCSMEVGICNSKESGILEERCLILDLIVISRIVDDLSIEDEWTKKAISQIFQHSDQIYKFPPSDHFTWISMFTHVSCAFSYLKSPTGTFKTELTLANICTIWH